VAQPPLSRIQFWIFFKEVRLTKPL